MEKDDTLIFISHAYKDKAIADAFINHILQNALEIPIRKIFCTSTEGAGIKSGDDFRNAIKSKLNASKVTFLIITPNYKESEMCLNEMGAAWVLSGLVLPTIIPPITYGTVGVIHEVNQVKVLLETTHLDDLKDVIHDVLGIDRSIVPSARWTIIKKQFIIALQKHLVEHPFQNPLERSSFEQAIAESHHLTEALTEMVTTNSELAKQIKELEAAKDATEVKSIKQRFNPDSKYLEFSALCSDIAGSLKRFTPYVRGIIFKDFTNKPQSSDWNQHRPAVEEAAAENYITIDEDTSEIRVDHETTVEIIELYSGLNDLSEFLEETQASDFINEYKEHHTAPLTLVNLKFWQEVLRNPIWLN